VIGSGAFALGRQSGTAGSTGKAAPAISLAGPEVAAGSAQRAPAVASSGAADSLAGPARFASERTVFSAEGLSAAAGTAQAWTYDSVAAFTREKASAMATALGLSGTPALVDGAWTVGAADGTGPHLRLQPDATVGVSYDDPTNNPYACADGSVKGAVPAPGVAEGAIAPTPTAPTPSAPTPAVAPDRCTGSSSDPAPSGPDAVARTRALIAAAGLDPSTFEYEANETGVVSVVSVTAWAVVDGQRTGQAWNLSLTARGVQNLWGQLAPVVPLGSYPVVSPQEAVTRLGDARFGGGEVGIYRTGVSSTTGAGTVSTDSATSGRATGGADGAMPQPLATSSGGTAAVAPAPASVPTLPPVPGSGARLSWPVQHVTLTGARLGLSAVQQADGSIVLAPAYELSDGSGRTWSVIAVAESALDLAPVG